MSYSAQQCFETARECELMVSEAKDNRAKELARQKEFLLDHFDDFERCAAHPSIQAMCTQAMRMPSLVGTQTRYELPWCAEGGVLNVLARLVEPMVREGWALAFIRYSGAYTAEEGQAREGQRGMWRGAFIRNGLLRCAKTQDLEAT
jgi:hypothetical protein